MTTYAHVTVIVVHDGVTTTYTLPMVKDFVVASEVDPHAIMDDGALSTLRFHPVRSAVFRMRPLPVGDDHSIMTVTSRPTPPFTGSFREAVTQIANRLA